MALTSTVFGAGSVASFGWCSFAPLSNELIMPGNFVILSGPTLIGAGLLGLGLLALSFLLGMRAGARSASRAPRPTPVD
ncbi:hypothetical protein [Microbacterium terricola]|uniref:Uncharacterized protein n=1 Tax=Microbacterium terricola TaxID=344163 RepID=A0ABM8E2W1_9MICO|nr:hypothetical protein [Microbacterium terricola]UYK39996.1 hypothetical protein OAU46_15110 [Microbacterium terricola]BDV32314.1 hypothetical protein Microterr_29740 [Microbacterium terricola]